LRYRVSLDTKREMEKSLRGRAAQEGGRAPLRAGDALPRSGLGDSAYVFDEERDLFRFHDGRFAFSREHAG
jgi:hypothetical protein